MCLFLFLFKTARKGVKDMSEKENQNKISLIEGGEKEKIVRILTVRKREVPLKRTYLKGDAGAAYRDEMRNRLWFYCNYAVNFEIKRGDVFRAVFPSSFGSELSGPHYVVAVNNSREKDGLISIVPLKSKKSKKPNPASDLELGIIEGLNFKEAIAVLNQRRSIDKYRIFGDELIRKVKVSSIGNELNNGHEYVTYKTPYRLTENQLNKLINALVHLIKYNYLKHDNNN